MNESDGQRPKTRRTRADALRNRQQILRAAAEVLIERGPTAPMELIARQAGVGIATLYRHFPDRTVLLRQVALDTLRRSTKVARAALAEEPDAFTALTRYMHDLIDLKVGAVMPAIAGRIPVDEELLEARRLSNEAHVAVATAAHEEGSLRPDVTAADISLLIIRFTPPIPGKLSPDVNRRLRHRHLELVLDGLLRFLNHDNLPGPGMSCAELTERLPVVAAGDGEIPEEALRKETGTEDS